MLYVPIFPLNSTKLRGVDDVSFLVDIVCPTIGGQVRSPAFIVYFTVVSYNRYDVDDLCL